MYTKQRFKQFGKSGNRTIIDDQDSEVSEKHEAGEMSQMYKGAKKALKKGNLVRQNIIDLVDTMIRRMRFLPTKR